MAAAAAVLLWMSVPGQAQFSEVNATSLTGTASFGMTNSSTQGSSNTSTVLNVDSILKGYYHHPSFLGFRVEPFFNFGHDTEFNRGTGVVTDLEFLGGSSYPLHVDYSLLSTALGLYSTVNGSVVGRTFNNNLNVNWQMRKEKLPQVFIGYSRNSNEFSVDGGGVSSPATTSLTHGWNLGTNYEVAGFDMGATFLDYTSELGLPNFTTATETTSTMHQRNLMAFVGHRLPLHSYFNVTGNRSRFESDLGGQQLDRKFNSVSTSVTSSPTPRLNFSVHGYYTSDELGSILEGVLGQPPKSSSAAAQPNVVSSIPTEPFKLYSGDAFVRLTIFKGLDFNGTLRQIASRAPVSLSTSATLGTFDQTQWTGGLTYIHRLWNGNFGTAFAYSRFRTSYPDGASLPSQDSDGQTGSVSYGRAFGKARYSASFFYGVGETVAFFPSHTRNVGGAMNVSRPIYYGWRGFVNFSMNDAQLEGPLANTTRTSTVSFGANNKSTTVSATWSAFDGLSIVTPGGIQPIPSSSGIPIQSVTGSLINPSSGSSLIFTGIHRPTRKLSVYFQYARSATDLFGATGEGIGSTHANRFNVSDSYRFRKLSIRGGYTDFWQSFSNLNTSSSGRAIYFVIVRDFRIF